MLIDVCVFCKIGDYYNGPPGDLDQEPDEDWVKSRQNEGRAYQEWDEDADVDESGEVLSLMTCTRNIATKTLFQRTSNVYVAFVVWKWSSRNKLQRFP